MTDGGRSFYKKERSFGQYLFEKDLFFFLIIGIRFAQMKKINRFFISIVLLFLVVVLSKLEYLLVNDISSEVHTDRSIHFD